MWRILELYMGKNGTAFMAAGVPVLASLAGMGLLVYWLSTWFAPTGIKPRSLDTGRPPRASTSSGSAPSGIPNPGSSTDSTTAGIGPGPSGVATSVPPMPGEWPGYRGARRDNIAPAEVKVPSSVSSLGLLWRTPVGEGYAGPAIKDGRVFLIDYDKDARREMLRCFSLAEGKEVWRNDYPAEIKRNHGVTRTIPATDGKVVVSLGALGTVLCADCATGQTKWSLDLTKVYGTEIPDWYAGQCPLIDDGKLILATAGSALIVALDLGSGKEVWRSPNPSKWTMTHSSVMPMEVGAEKLYVYCGSGGIAGVSAKNGSVLWQSTDWTVDTATIPSPLPVGDGKLFLAGGYNAGSLMLQVLNTGGKWSAKTLFRLAPEVFGSDLQTPILYQGKIYGVAPTGELVCLSLDGKRLWSSGTARFGMGAFMIADGKILALNDHGGLTLAEASAAAYRPYGSLQVLQGRESWGPMAIAGDLLLARDFETLVCIRMGGGK